MMPPESLKLRVLEAVQQHPAPRRTDLLPSTIALTALAAAGMLALLEWGPILLGSPGGVGHAAGRPSVIGVWVVGGIVVLALASTWLVLPSRRSMLSPPRGLLVGVAIALPLLVGAWLVLWHGTYDEPLATIGKRCFALTTLTAPWPFVVLAYASRRAEPRHPGTVGAALGAVAGAWAAVMDALWCSQTGHAHVLVGHALPLAVLTLVGSAIGARMFRLRRG
jgi:hypothetical protein